MKALLYKEFKLAWHPLCYIFPILFSLFILIPNYPAWVGLMLVGITYTILFLGANKGKQTNDLYYTVNLPVKKADIVISRFISMAIMQVMALAITCAFSPIAKIIFDTINSSSGGHQQQIGFNYDTIGMIVAFGLIGFILVDAVYLLMFYKKGRSIIAPSLIGLFGFMIFMTIFATVLPIAVKPYYDFFASQWWIQIIAIVIALIIYGVSHIFILKGAIKRINKINF